MAPMAPDPSFGQGVQSGNQQTYLQQTLANARNLNEQKEQQAQITVPTESLHPAAAKMALNTTMGPDGRQVSTYKNMLHLNDSLQQGELARTRETAVQTQQSLGRDILAGELQRNGGKAMDDSHPLKPTVNALMNSQVPLPPDMVKEALQYRDMKSSVPLGGQPVDKFGNPIGEPNMPATSATPVVTPDSAEGKRRIAEGQTFDQKTVTDAYGRQTQTYDWKQEAVAQTKAKDALRGEGWTPDMPGYAQALYSLTNRPTPWTEGGGVAVRGEMIPRPPGSPQAAPGPAPAPALGQGLGEKLRTQAADKNANFTPEDRAAMLRSADLLDKASAQVPNLAQNQPSNQPTRTPGGGIVSPLKPADVHSQQVAQGADSVLSGITQLRKYLDDPEVARWRGSEGTSAQLKARGRGLIEDKTHISLLSDNERAARAALADYQAEFRKGMYGVRVTAPETAIIKSIIASDISDPALPQKLAEVERVMRNHRDEIDANLRNTRRQPIPQVPAGPDKTAPSSRTSGTIPVVGPNGERGTVPAGTDLSQHPGWKAR